MKAKVSFTTENISTCSSQHFVATIETRQREKCFENIFKKNLETLFVSLKAIEVRKSSTKVDWG